MMLESRQRIQLAVFALVAVLAVAYGGVHILDIGKLLSPPFRVSAEFSTSGGIYPHADVDYLGIRVGTVTAVEPAPAGGTRVLMALDSGSKVPRDVRATVTDKSALGEQYVELQPVGPINGLLRPGDSIPRSRTATPVRVDKLLSDLDGLAGSVPLKALHTALQESSIGLAGTGPTLGRLIDDSERLTAATQANADELGQLIDSARTVLGTQAELAPQTRDALHQAAGTLTQIQSLDTQLAAVFGSGSRAGAQVTRLLIDLQPVLPLLFGNLGTLTDLLANRGADNRKTLVLFPWVLQLGAGAIRYCDDFDPKTGKAVPSSCHYDAQGRPIYTSHFAFQLPESPGSPPYLPCTEGYEGTIHYQPDGTPVGSGAPEAKDGEVNLKAGCTAPANDPNTPNVRGAQNVH